MAVQPGSISVAPSTAGKLLDTVTVVTSEGTVHREGVFIGDPASPGNRAGVTAAGGLQVDGSGVTQPVSIAATINAAILSSVGLDVSGSTVTVAGTVAVSNFPASYPVTGTFWQATQPVSGTVNVSSGTILGGSTAMVGHVIVDSGGGAGSTTVDANLSSAGSTRLVGQVTVANPTTAVTYTNAPTTAVTVTNPTTAVDLSSNGSTRVVGLVGQSGAPWSYTSTGTLLSSGTQVIGSVAPSSQWTMTVGNPTTSVTFTNAPTTAVTVSSGVVLGAGSSANTLGSVALVAGSTANSIGSVALVAGSSANVIGTVVISSASNEAVTLTSGVATLGRLLTPSTAARSNITSATAESTFLAANSARMGAMLFNDATANSYVGLSTVAVSTTSYSVKMPPGGYYELPFAYTGMIRGMWDTSGVTGSMRITEISS
jgi:hypothetical protein